MSKPRNREDGTLDSITNETEFRLHLNRHTLTRVPWHRDWMTGEWYEGIPGPPMDVDALLAALSGRGP